MLCEYGCKLDGQAYKNTEASDFNLENNATEDWV